MDPCGGEGEEKAGLGLLLLCCLCSSNCCPLFRPSQHTHLLHPPSNYDTKLPSTRALAGSVTSIPCISYSTSFSALGPRASSCPFAGFVVGQRLPDQRSICWSVV